MHELLDECQSHAIVRKGQVVQGSMALTSWRNKGHTNRVYTLGI